jgi:hypothetical protein
MTFLEAIHSIEKVVSRLGMRYKDGERMEPIRALGKIGRFHGSRYDSVIHQMSHQQITVEEYYLEMMKMIQEYWVRVKP